MKKRNVMLVILLLLIDQGSKGLMEAILTGKSITVIPNFFSLVFVTNTGAAWSIMQGNTLFLIILGIIAIFSLIFVMPTIKESIWKSISFTMLYAGIIGNLLDRAIFHYVKDFLKFTIFGYEYPVFNFADIFIVVGAILLIVAAWKGDIDEKNKRRKHS